jgi:transposase
MLCIITGSPAVHSPVGDPLQIYADRFSGHYEVLCPRLQPGQVVVMDNLPAHKVEGVRRLLEAVGAELLYLPPYSPDFNPIEQAWSKIKQQLRSAKARTVETLESAIEDALAAVTQHHAAAWFAHCGYAIQ